MKRVFISLMIFCNPVFAEIDLFTNCRLVMLVSSCNIGRDSDAPARMREGGPASCFVGLELANRMAPDIDTPFGEIIREEGYQKIEYKDEIKEVNSCITDVHELQKCNLGFVRTKGLETIKSCSDLIQSNKPKVIKTNNTLDSDVFEFSVPQGWRLVKESINRDNIKYYFVDKQGNHIQLTISDHMTPSHYEAGKKAMKDGIKKLWSSKNLEMVSHSIVDIGAHKSADEQIGKIIDNGSSLAMYYLYGGDRIAIISLSFNSNKKNLTSMSHNLIESFSWK